MFVCVFVYLCLCVCALCGDIHIYWLAEGDDSWISLINASGFSTDCIYICNHTEECIYMKVLIYSNGMKYMFV